MPFPIPPTTAVGLLGLVVQLGACFLVTALVFGVRRAHRKLEYMAWWSWGWVAVSVAIAAVGARYLVLPQLLPAGHRSAEGPLIAFYLVYQTAKLLFFGFLSLGILTLVAERPSRSGEVVAFVAGALGLGLGSILMTRDLDLLVMIQAAIAVPIFGVGAWMVGTMPPARRGFGSRTLTFALVVLAIQWAFYLQGFAFRETTPTTPYLVFLRYLTGYNSFFDAGQLTHLGIGMVLTLLDWSHREAGVLQAAKLREAAAAEKRLAEILLVAHEGIVTLDRARQIDLINPAAVAILGLEGDRARGQGFDRFIIAHDGQGIWGEASSSGDPTRQEVTGVRANGETFPLEVSISALGPELTHGYVLVLRDLTDQLNEREAQEQVQGQLAQAARLEAMGRMVSGVAHELNNPLTAIIAFAQDLLTVRRSAEEDREALTVIMQQADRCRVIVGDLLTFARSRRDERRLANPDELVRRVARVFEHDSARLGVTLEVEIAPLLPEIEVDAVGIEQVLTNLLTNAFQASPRGGHVSLRVTADRHWVEFRVEDQGPGISPEAFPRLFEPFFTTKGPGQGTGLGLSVSHAIVQQHRGRIEASNRTGGNQGARFIVQLPVVARADQTGLPRRVSAESEVAPMNQRSKALVVDDEPAIRAAIRRALERAGWAVEEAGDGAAAWRWLELNAGLTPLDVIITDLRMPGTSGIELVERLRLEYPDLADRTLVITGDTASPQVADFLAGLKTPYLQKPFDMKTIVEQVDRIRTELRR